MSTKVDDRIDGHKGRVYRTKHFTQAQIDHLKEKATDQEKDIARWFFRHPTAEVGPSALHAQQGYDWPLTSTRRAITNLTDAGILFKTDRTATGEFGRPEHLWTWRAPARGEGAQQSMFEEPERKHKNGVAL